MSRTLYEDALWLPWIDGNALHRPGDSYARTTKCGIYVGEDQRTRMTDLRSDDERGFFACPLCFPEASNQESRP
jgi:hypothetical protein